MTTQTTLKTLGTLMLTGLLSACGSSSSSSFTEGNETDNSTPGNTLPDNQSSPGLQYPVFHPETIEEGQVELLISEVHSFNDLWIAALRQQFGNLTLSRNILASSYASGRFSYDQRCDGTGRMDLDVYHKGSLEDENGIRIYEPGDYLDIIFRACQLGKNVSYYISGRHKREVLQGYFDDSEYLRLPVSVSHSYEDIVLDLSANYGTNIELLNEFKDGDLTWTLSDENHVRAHGSVFAEKSKSVRFRSSYVMENYDLQLTRIPGRYDWLSEYEFDAAGAFNLSMISLQAKYAIRYQAPIQYRDYDSSFLSGKFVIEGLGSSIEVTYFDSYVQYRFDGNGDGQYETENTLLMNEL